MLRLGYDRRLAIGVVCAGGSLGTMIPPSIVLIFYGLTANVSIGDLFAAALLPGLLLAGIYIVYVLAVCTWRPEAAPLPPREDVTRRMPPAQVVAALGGPLAIVAAVLGTIYFGIASISEASAMGVLAVLALGLAQREIGWRDLQEALVRTFKACGMLMWLTLGATAFIGVYNLMGGIRFMGEVFGGFDLSPLGMIMVMLLVFFVLGMIIDWLGILFLTMPIFVPIIRDLGYDPVWFGVIFCMSMQVSYLTPPFGWAALYLKSVAPPDISLAYIYRSLVPFILLQMVAIALVLAFPGIALWLPSLR
jgi:tripartite ATP-independent transporter DctM subunit